jgi:hypothetical protein
VAIISNLMRSDADGWGIWLWLRSQWGWFGIERAVTAMRSGDGGFVCSGVILAPWALDVAVLHGGTAVGMCA